MDRTRAEGTSTLSQFALAVSGAGGDLGAKKEASFGGLPTRQTCHLAGPPVYEPASLLASRRANARDFAIQGSVRAEKGLISLTGTALEFTLGEVRARFRCVRRMLILGLRKEPDERQQRSKDHSREQQAGHAQKRADVLL